MVADNTVTTEGDGITTVFGVTDDQLAQMREIRESGGSREDMRSVLSDDQRQQMQTWSMRRESHPWKSDGSRHVSGSLS